MRVLASLLLASLATGCGSAPAGGGPGTRPDGGAPLEASTDAPEAGPFDSGVRDARAEAAGADVEAGPALSAIRHVVLIVQENHSFDSYFGRYCLAPAGSNPTCTLGPSCCEGAPAREPSGAMPVTLDDKENADYDPSHLQACEMSEMNGGKMDRYVTGASCSDARNFAIASDSVVRPYTLWAQQYALADRFFQPIAGQSSSNDMYLAVAQYVFTDNAVQPDTNGHGCNLPPTPTAEYSGKTTIADLLIGGGHSFAVYAEGYAAMVASSTCPSAPADCTAPVPVPTPPCVYTPSDIPFEFYSQLADNKAYMKDLADLTSDIQAGQLPSFSYVKRVQYRNEHPGYGTTISNGTAAVQQVVDLVLGSAYADSTLVLLTWDESGGFFDHVPPPPTSPVDHQPYGPRVPTLAIGRFARQAAVSHVVMEHSSIVKFLEWNFLGATGQLGARDATVANIGSLLDPTQTGIVVPEN